MSKKTYSKFPTQKNKHSLERKLLSFAKRGQPVLLHGFDSYGREKLIKKVHLLNGGIDAGFEYQGLEENIKNIDDLKNEVRKAKESQDYEKEEKLLTDCKATVRTFKYMSFFLCDVEKVYTYLSEFEYKWSLDTGEVCSTMHDMPKEVVGDICIVRENSQLKWRKGLLFLDNLKYEKNDTLWYEILALNIEKRRIIDTDVGNWLVAYARDCGTFPEVFLEQFKLVSLDHIANEFLEIVAKSECKQQKQSEEPNEAITLYNALLRETSFQSDDNVFIKKSDYWIVQFDNKLIPLEVRGNKGLEYIACILDNQGKDLHVLQLVELIKKRDPSKMEYSKEYTDYGLDREYIQELGSRTQELQEELDDDEIPKSDEIIAEMTKEIEDINKVLSAGTEKGGKPRKMKDNAERARRSVTKIINESLGKIKTDHPSLWEHFNIYLNIGTYCSYKSEKPIPWEL